MQTQDPFQSLYRNRLQEGSFSVSEGPETSGSGYFSFRGLRISRVGFGGYRIGLSDPEHREALEYSLESGVNLVDVSANYGDGEAEGLVGDILSQKAEEMREFRKKIFIVTKAGYIQGRNLRVLEAREKEGRGFSEITRYQNGLFHCISPDFLEDQLERSRKRLGVFTIDGFLLHNPEYYLMLEEKKGQRREEARKEYYRRVRTAFGFLERARKEGKIRYYGISSNTFPVPEDRFTHTSLSKVLQMAKEAGGEEHGFAIVQFPGNWYEDGFLRNKNSEGRTILDLCEENTLLPLINRPLNSFREGIGMLRLSYSPGKKEPDLSKVLQNFSSEAAIIERLEDSEGLPSLSGLWSEYGDRIQTEEQFQILLERSWIPELRKTIDRIHSESGKADAEEYIGILNATLPRLSEVLRQRGEEKLSSLYENLSERFPNPNPPKSLSSLMVSHLASLLSHGSVLLGMRRRYYVDDILPLFRNPWPKISSKHWGEHGIRS